MNKIELFANKYRIQSSRYLGWNYANSGAYFVTICTKQRKAYFGSIRNQRMIKSDLGDVAHTNWNQIHTHFPYATMDNFVIMPNHIHGIIWIDNNEMNIPNIESRYRDVDVGCRRDVDVGCRRDVDVGCRRDVACNVSTDNVGTNFMSYISPKYGSLPTIIRSYKSACTNAINKLYPEIKFGCQPRYYDRIIRSQNELEKIRSYINRNPHMWNRDRNNL